MSVTFVTNEDMAVIDEKVDKLLQSASFRVVRGIYAPTETVPANTTITIPCPAGAKLFVIMCDDATDAAIKQLTDALYHQGFIANFVDDTSAEVNPRNTLALIWAGTYNQNGGGSLTASNTEGFTITTGYPILPGTYNWTAYYWDE